MVVASQGPQAGRQETAVVPIAAVQPQAEATGAFGVASNGNLSTNSFKPYCFRALKIIDMSNPEERNGSLIITVECSSLEILEGLWEDYCTGLLNEMAQKFLVTEDLLKELGLTEAKLTTTILEEEYGACRKHFIQYSAMEVDAEAQFILHPHISRECTTEYSPQVETSEMMESLLLKEKGLKSRSQYQKHQHNYFKQLELIVHHI
ncbi:hypothetical protein OS493_034870 [Desmophyllum pertusum]|uniref:TRADD-like N-terminal domain-containing protein n=1 Tax=Desmophyllum pertusum TaxID=174260 RepID=A0A9W9ZWS9_9CNID|nr:hypothetical protein OS493_034870 [Desmophyllum pertusum]